ncbi:MAG TPA: universal stress protein, partial [Aquaticitalea sp.]|nr:universal stress protein [Aquaticitalea sp.]
MKTNKNNYKILVLSDLKDPLMPVLKSAISLSKMIGGNIDFFHVKKPTDIVEIDNQLTAIRGINHVHNTIDKKIRDQIRPIADEYGVAIAHHFAIGNVRDQISKAIDAFGPDIIVLGKKKRKPISIIGDSIIQFVLNKCQCAVMIADNHNVPEPNKSGSFATINKVSDTFDLEFADALMKHVQQPYRSYKLVKKHAPLNVLEDGNDGRYIDYIFEQADNSIKNMSRYLSKSNVNLLYMDRPNKKTKEKPNMLEPNLIEAINDLKTSLIVANG